MVTELMKDVYWIGVVDWGLRHFHGHELSTHRGSTYNSYLIRDEKTVLVDTAWGPFQEEWLEKMRNRRRPAAKIDIVVANHAEPDHSGSFPPSCSYAPTPRWSFPSGARRASRATTTSPGSSGPSKTGDAIASARTNSSSSRRRCSTGPTACSPT